jgi:hypothetical protein
MVCFKWVIFFSSFSAQVTRYCVVPDGLSPSSVVALILSGACLTDCSSCLVNLIRLLLVRRTERVEG